MRHSCEHVLTQVMLKLWPKIKMAMGPATEDGFYFDLDPGDLKLSEADFPKIEAEMAKIIKENLPIRKKTLTVAEARKLFKNNPYKQEWLNGIKAKRQKPTVYWTGKEFVDLCAGPHVSSTGKIGAFKLLSIAGAYWHGSEKNKMLTRIYGTCFPTQKELDQYLWLQEEAKKRDHRKIGKEQELFLSSQDVGPGLPIFLPRGFIIRDLLEKYIMEEKKKRGYLFVWTPHITRSSLYQKSGHWQKYDAMFNPMKLDDEDYVLKPMNCPHHFQIYLERPRSYRELPLRIAENATVYRYEKSGEIGGLLRVRSLTQDDTHTFLRKEQIPEEIDRILDLTETVYRVFSFKDYRARISTRDPKNKQKYLGSDKIWQLAEKSLITAAKKRKLNYFLGHGEAAFYGPKIDVLMKDSLGREWQLTTVQLDFNQPENFQMVYTNEKGEQERPAILHIAILGTLERFLGILIEHLGGAFPVWLSPIQTQVIPVADRHLDYARKVAKIIKDQDIRVELKDEQETVSKKIRNGELQKIPYLLVVGDREMRAKNVAVRQRKKGDLGQMKLEDFIDKVKKEIKEKK